MFHLFFRRFCTYNRYILKDINDTLYYIIYIWIIIGLNLSELISLSMRYVGIDAKANFRGHFSDSEILSDIAFRRLSSSFNRNPNEIPHENNNKIVFPLISCEVHVPAWTDFYFVFDNMGFQSLFWMFTVRL